MIRLPYHIRGTCIGPLRIGCSSRPVIPSLSPRAVRSITAFGPSLSYRKFTFGTFFRSENPIPRESDPQLSEAERFEAKRATIQKYVNYVNNAKTSQELEEAIDKLRADGTHLDTLTYDILLAGLLRFNAFDRVIFLADRMRADGVQYSVQTYNSVINAHLHRNDYMRAAATWLLLEGSGLSPDLNSWNLRLSMCRGRDEMLRIWNKMKELGLPGHHRTYLILFSKTLIKASNWDDILEFYNDMKQKGVEPQKQLLILLVTAAKRYGAPESVKTMIKEVAERVAKQPDNGPQVDQIMTEQIAQSYSELSKKRKAQRLNQGEQLSRLTEKVERLKQKYAADGK